MKPSYRANFIIVQNPLAKRNKINLTPKCTKKDEEELISNQWTIMASFFLWIKAGNTPVLYCRKRPVNMITISRPKHSTTYTSFVEFAKLRPCSAKQIFRYIKLQLNDSPMHNCNRKHTSYNIQDQARQEGGIDDRGKHLLWIVIKHCITLHKKLWLQYFIEASTKIC